MALAAAGMTRNALKLVLAALAFHLLLIQPNHPAAMTWAAFLSFRWNCPSFCLV
jgi:hypothetical protein